MAAALTIGRLARKAGVNIQTIFYYERRGLLSPARGESGYRLFDPEDVRVIRFIKNAQELGFSLEEIGRLLKLRVGRRAQCARVRRQAEARRKVVREKLERLRAMDRALERLIGTCAKKGTTDSCPILDSLEDGGRAS